MRIAMLVVFVCCTLFSLVTAGLVINAGHSGAATIFLAFGLLFGCLTGALLQGMRRRESPAGSTSAGGNGQHPGFVPHWFMMATLVITVVSVVGSILWRLVR